ncbi:MAG: SUMF1/EgtB/PvdO family nonheme iron enzyme [Alphaproteobacteria bacterium]|nr:SUMF1/EgtB/PvdO family nonheme iron enzyme [Alphaproteobacteria bacterium]
MRGYLAWLAERTGRPWRLPGELEFEKAARGVDGRYFPWGDQSDPAWSCMADSHRDERQPVSVDAFPVDCSVWGVRHLGGATSSLAARTRTAPWCLPPRSRASSSPRPTTACSSRAAAPGRARRSARGAARARGSKTTGPRCSGSAGPTLSATAERHERARRRPTARSPGPDDRCRRDGTALRVGGR